MLAGMKRIALLVLLSSGTAAFAAPVLREGQSFNEAYEAGKTALRLHNASLLTVGYVFKVYVAGLYLADDSDTSRVLDDVPKRLEIAYLRDVTKKIIVDASEDHFRKNLKPAQIAALRDRLDAINKLYSDVKEGDRYALTYFPGAGCELALNGKPLGTIPGADFASAYFGIWLGQGCAKPELRDALLGKAGAQKN